MKTILIIFLLLPSAIFSQSNSSIDILGGISFTNSHFIKRTQLISGENKNKNQFNWQFGLSYNINLKPKIFLKTGIKLKSMGVDGEKITDLRWPSEQVGGVFVPDPTLPRELQQITNHLFMEIPIGIRYEYNQKKITPYTELVFSPNYYLRTKEEQRTDIDVIETNARYNIFKTIHFSLTAIQGVGFSISNEIELFSQMFYQYHVSGLSKFKDSTKEKLYGFGFELGLRKELN